jgi:UDP-GlcNAc:undecaprenyl-phosphate/decaprenyl-phosphate GlcNAc-1-phosphate transferase
LTTTIIEKLNYPHLGLFILSWFLVDRFVPVITFLCKKLNLLDTPGEYKLHKEGTPYLGGVAVVLSVSIAVFSLLRFEYVSYLKPLIAIVVCSFVVLIMGVIDDIKKISAIIKLFVMLCLSFVLYFYEVRLELFSGNFAFLNIILSTLWLSGVASAFNSIDNSDGICSGTTAITAFFFFLINWVYYGVIENPMWKDIHKIASYASISVCGATLGFLRYNFPPAKIFLGNNGAFSIGFFLGALSILGVWSTYPLKAIIIPIFILGTPIYDLTFTTILRFKNGWIKTIPQAIKWCGNDHLAHRLKNLKLSDALVAFLIYILAAIFGLGAFVLANPYLPTSTFYFLVIIFVIFLVLLTYFLDKIPVDISNAIK